MGASDAKSFTLHIEGVDADAEDLDRWARQLRSEFEEAELGTAELSHEGALPAGAKSAELITAGSLAVMVLPTLLPKLVEFLQSYVLKRMDRKIKIKTNSFELEIPPGSMSTEQQSQLIGLLRNAGNSPGESKENK